MLAFYKVSFSNSHIYDFPTIEDILLQAVVATYCYNTAHELYYYWRGSALWTMRVLVHVQLPVLATATCNYY